MDALVFLAIAFMLGSFVVRPAQRLDAERSPRLIAAGAADPTNRGSGSTVALV